MNCASCFNPRNIHDNFCIYCGVKHPVYKPFPESDEDEYDSENSNEAITIDVEEEEKDNLEIYYPHELCIEMNDRQMITVDVSGLGNVIITFYKSENH